MQHQHQRAEEVLRQRQAVLVAVVHRPAPARMQTARVQAAHRRQQRVAVDSMMLKVIVHKQEQQMMAHAEGINSVQRLLVSVQLLKVLELLLEMIVLELPVLHNVGVIAAMATRRRLWRRPLRQRRHQPGAEAEAVEPGKAVPIVPLTAVRVRLQHPHFLLAQPQRQRLLRLQRVAMGHVEPEKTVPTVQVTAARVLRRQPLREGLRASRVEQWV